MSSATPGDYELENEWWSCRTNYSSTGLLDPTVEVRPTKNQIDDLIGEIRKQIAKNNAL